MPKATRLMQHFLTLCLGGHPATKRSRAKQTSNSFVSCDARWTAMVQVENNWEKSIRFLNVTQHPPNWNQKAAECDMAGASVNNKHVVRVHLEQQRRYDSSRDFFSKRLDTALIAKAGSSDGYVKLEAFLPFFFPRDSFFHPHRTKLRVSLRCCYIKPDSWAVLPCMKLTVCPWKYAFSFWAGAMLVSARVF